jgi:hypothetical protein
VNLIRTFGKLAMAGAVGVALTACVYEPAPYYGYPAYGYAPAPAYYGPAYYGPSVAVGVGGFGGHWRR